MLLSQVRSEVKCSSSLPVCLGQASCTVLATWEPANRSNVSFPCIAEGQHPMQWFSPVGPQCVLNKIHL